jgi:transcriptional regulator with XRE-family HTH domain
MEYRRSARIILSMRATLSPPPPAPSSHVGDLLREWRGVRGISQLALALEADVSSRHLSYVETGKAQPSRDLVVRLADALSLPLRERNALLVAAGYAPMFRESSLTTPEMAPARQAIEFILKQQEPYPALVTNRHWDLLLTNQALIRVFGLVRGRSPIHANVMHQIFDPGDMRGVLGNWEEVAGDLIHHLHNEVAAAPTDARARQLLEEVLAYPDIPPHWRTREPGATPLPLLTTVLRNEEVEFRFFSTISTFGTARDVTIDELRIECMFPADEETAERCRALAGGSPLG